MIIFVYYSYYYILAENWLKINKTGRLGIGKYNRLAGDRCRPAGDENKSLKIIIRRTYNRPAGDRHRPAGDRSWPNGH